MIYSQLLKRHRDLLDCKNWIQKAEKFLQCSSVCFSGGREHVRIFKNVTKITWKYSSASDPHSVYALCLSDN